MDAAGDRPRIERIRQLFEAAIEKTAAERESFVRHAAGDDSALAAAVFELLRAAEAGENTAAELVGAMQRASARDDADAGRAFDAMPVEMEQRFYEALLAGDPAGVAVRIASLCAAAPAHERAIRQRRDHFQSPEFLAEDGEDLLRRLRKVWAPSRHARRYVQVSELGQGGFGVVSVVRDRLLGRKVAHKTLRSKWGSALHLLHPEIGHRFLDEAQIAAQLLHPGIPLLHDVGATPLGVPFFTMRLIRGETLDAVIKKHHHGDAAWPRDRVLRLLLEVADAVGYAHGEDVLHRDLKAQNVLIGRFGETCVLDWGLSHAHRLASRRRESAGVLVDRVARLASRGGSPGFTAPEQWDGEVHAGCDVFSLGAILHMVLLGMPPPRLRRDGDYRVPPPDHRRDRVLFAVCERAVAPQMTRRFRTMREFREALAGCVARSQRPAVWRRMVGAWARLSSRGPADAPTRTRESGGWHAMKPPPGELSLVQRVDERTMAGDGAARGRPAGSEHPDSRFVGLPKRLATVVEIGVDRVVFGVGTEVGAGGMATVTRHVDSRLGRPVALKTSRTAGAAEFADELLLRALDEPQVAGQIDHPAVLSPHDLGVDAEGRLFVVQPFVPAGTLSGFLEQQALPAWAAACRLLLQVARGLGYAHERGVLHRDVKPMNILLGRHGDAYLADWGLAVLLGETSPGDSEPIRVHRGTDFAEAEWRDRGLAPDGPEQIVGTPIYMAPERFGDARMQRSSDVYSLGACLFEILTASRRFPHPGRGVMALMEAVTTTPHPTVAERNARAPRRLAAVCDRALAFHPQARFQDAGEFALALEDALARSR